MRVIFDHHITARPGAVTTVTLAIQVAAQIGRSARGWQDVAVTFCQRL